MSFFRKINSLPSIYMTCTLYKHIINGHFIANPPHANQTGRTGRSLKTRCPFGTRDALSRLVLWCRSRAHVYLTRTFWSPRPHLQTWIVPLEKLTPIYEHIYLHIMRSVILNIQPNLIYRQEQILCVIHHNNILSRTNAGQ